MFRLFSAIRFLFKLRQIQPALLAYLGDWAHFDRVSAILKLEKREPVGGEKAQEWTLVRLNDRGGEGRETKLYERDTI